MDNFFPLLLYGPGLFFFAYLERKTEQKDLNKVLGKPFFHDCCTGRACIFGHFFQKKEPQNAMKKKQQMKND